MMNVKEILTNKKKEFITGCVVGTVLIVCGGMVVYGAGDKSPKLKLKRESFNIEYGERFDADFDTLIETKGISKKDKEYLQKNIQIKSNIKSEVETVTKEDGSTEEKSRGYSKIGDYKITVNYKDETKTANVSVRDTTKPDINAPEMIDIIQYTDLSTFNFAELLEVTDYSNVKDWQIDTSEVDVNTVGQYDLKISISDVEENTAEKDMKINVVEAPAIENGEVAVTEIVTDENGKKKTVVTKKAIDSVSATDSVSAGKPVQNVDKVENGSETSSNKPSKPSTPSGGNSGNSGNTDNTGGSTGNGGNTDSTGGNSSGNTDDNKPSHSHTWEAVTKTVHHDAETKVVHHAAETKVETVTVVDKPAWDEPVYEGHVVCVKCNRDFGGGENGVEKWAEHTGGCNGRYTIQNVQTGTKHHDAVTHQEQKTVVVKPAWDETVIIKEAWDETVTTGYKCSCGATKNK